MKQLLFFIILLFVGIEAQAQLNISGAAGTGFYLVTLEGDTLHLRGATPFYATYRIALQDAANWSRENGCDVYIRSNMNERVRFHDGDITAVTDTVFLPAAASGELLSDVEWSIIEVNPPVETYTFRIDGRTAGDSIHINYECSGTAAGDFGIISPDSLFTHTAQLDCPGSLIYKVSATASPWQTTFTDTVDIAFLRSFGMPEPENVFHTDFSDFNAEEWFVSWGTITAEVSSGSLVLTIPERSIGRLHWDRVPEHRNARVYIKETLHPSHGSGVHTSLRASRDLPRNALEGFIHGPGMGFSYFLDGSWGNPDNIGFAWEDGDTIEYIIEVIDDRVGIKVWKTGQAEPDEFQYWQDDIAGQVPAGGFSIGATGAGTYIIDEIEIEILD